ncbi:MAG: DNA-binding protein [Candidatus Aadella gelida]|nr:DNA-binding protein [Candidatus Aadella gelida]
MQTSKGRVFIGRFNKGEDLLSSLSTFCEKNNISKGVFSVIGAVSSAKMGYFKQDVQKYIDCVSMNRCLEICSCTGNISVFEDKIFVHAHVTLADHEGNCYGGHLMPGSKIFAAEYYITELEGSPLVREPDPETGLNLWPNG